jgi:hypothetical protein
MGVHWPAFEACSLQPAASFCDDQAVNRQVSFLAMNRETETVCQQRLQHPGNLILVWIASGFRFDVKAVGSHPRRTSEKLEVADIVCGRDQLAQGCVLRHQPAAGCEPDTASLGAGKVGLDCGDIECGLGMAERSDEADDKRSHEA